MGATFCVDCLEETIRTHGRPEIFNSGQGSQFTSEAFTNILQREGIVISMDGRGRVFDNIFVERLWCSVKHENVYLKGYATMGELMIGLTEYFACYNIQRPHQSLGQITPDVVCRSGTRGGAMILDKYPRTEEDRISETEGVKESPAIDVRAEENAKAEENSKAKAAPSSCE